MMGEIDIEPSDMNVTHQTTTLRLDFDSSVPDGAIGVIAAVVKEELERVGATVFVSNPVASEEAVHIIPTVYSNFCRTIGTPEEVVLDFGLDVEQFSARTKPINIDARVVLNYYTVKRLLGTVHAAVQRHESAFGVTELKHKREQGSTTSRHH